MKLSTETHRDRDAMPQVGKVLAEALPWIKAATGKTIIIKYGGSAMVDEKLREDVMSDIVLLKIMGMNPVIIHGGGAAITSAMKKFNMPVEFKTGCASPATRPWTSSVWCWWARSTRIWCAT